MTSDILEYSYIDDSGNELKVVPIRSTLHGTMLEGLLTSHGYVCWKDIQFGNCFIVNEKDKTFVGSNVSLSMYNLFEVKETQEGVEIVLEVEEMVKIAGLYFLKSDWNNFKQKAIKEHIYFP